jgi:hypothetical protein
MTDQSALGVVPTRTITIDSRKLPLIATSWVSPVVLLDGHRFPLGWGPRVFTVPADRPVHIQCEMPYLYTYGRASAVLEPHHIPELEYSAPAMAFFTAEMGAPGTTATRGMWALWLMLGVGLLALTLGAVGVALSLGLATS